jgi:2-oxoglutarate dehydrogenase E1 component
MLNMRDFSFITHSHPAYIEALYQDFSKDPSSVDPEWVKFFEGFDFAVSGINGKKVASVQGAPVSDAHLAKELAVYRLIVAYRRKGHLVAKTNPIRPRQDRRANLSLDYFGLRDADLKTSFMPGSL